MGGIWKASMCLQSNLKLFFGVFHVAYPCWILFKNICLLEDSFCHTIWLKNMVNTMKEVVVNLCVVGGSTLRNFAEFVHIHVNVPH